MLRTHIFLARFDVLPPVLTKFTYLLKCYAVSIGKYPFAFLSTVMLQISVQEDCLTRKRKALRCSEMSINMA